MIWISFPSLSRYICWIYKTVQNKSLDIYFVSLLRSELSNFICSYIFIVNNDEVGHWYLIACYFHDRWCNFFLNFAVFSVARCLFSNISLNLTFINYMAFDGTKGTRYKVIAIGCARRWCAAIDTNLETITVEKWCFWAFGRFSYIRGDVRK